MKYGTPFTALLALLRRRSLDLRPWHRALLAPRAHA
jgi:hypothetical protein